MPSPRHIVVYASDHGFGHAMRMLALAAHLHHAGHRVTVCAGEAADMLRPGLQRLKGPAGAPTVHLARLDLGLVPSGLGVDHERTGAALAAWLPRLPALIDEERARLRALGADLVIADAPAAAVAAAAHAGVPSVVCSNFTWLDLYGDRYGADIADALHHAYAMATLGIRLSPGRMPLAGVPRVRDLPDRLVLARRPRRSRAEIRAALGATQDEPLLALGLGRSLDPTLPAQLLSGQSADVRLLLPRPRPAASGPAAPTAPPEAMAPSAPPEAAPAAPGPAASRGARPPALFFPPDDPDAQDYFATADAVLAKAGYSSIAEAALAGVPLLLFPLPGNPESALLCAEAAAQGLAGALADETDARRMCRSPAEALRRARAATHHRAHDAGPAILAILTEEGLV